MKQLKGSEMSETAKDQALSCYVRRYTKDHKPRWVRDTKSEPVQFASDADWLAHTLFWVREDGSLMMRRYCDSSATWPDNPELRAGSKQSK
jgi:hypothetical protein